MAILQVLGRPTVDLENQKLEKKPILSASLQESSCPAYAFSLYASPQDPEHSTFPSLGLPR